MKYHNKKVVYNGIKFDSKKEAHRYCELRLLAKAGEITDLQRQVEYELIPKQVEYYTVVKNGKSVEKSRVIERPTKYIADFVYRQKNGDLVVEDVKSTATRTTEYIIKRKLLLQIYGIRIKEI